MLAMTIVALGAACCRSSSRCRVRAAARSESGAAALPARSASAGTSCGEVGPSSRSRRAISARMAGKVAAWVPGWSGVGRIPRAAYQAACSGSNEASINLRPGRSLKQRSSTRTACRQNGSSFATEATSHDQRRTACVNSSSGPAPARGPLPRLAKIGVTPTTRPSSAIANSTTATASGARPVNGTQPGRVMSAAPVRPSDARLPAPEKATAFCTSSIRPRRWLASARSPRTRTSVTLTRVVVLPPALAAAAVNQRLASAGLPVLSSTRPRRLFTSAMASPL